MSVLVSSSQEGMIEYINSGPFLWFRLDLKSGNAIYFDEDGREIAKPDYAGNPYKTAGLSDA